MHIAFYAPLKPPVHAVPSGDRRIGRLLIDALTLAGHEVALASRLRSRDGAGDALRQRRLATLGERLAARFLRRTAPLPELWFTYHLYDKAPDHLGPRIAGRLGIPYVVAEASAAPNRAGGAWAAGYASTAAALGRADAVIGLNEADAAGVLPLLRDPARYHRLLPFLDLRPFAAARLKRTETRATLAARFGLDPTRVWIVALAMMRRGVKLDSYRVLAAALTPLVGRHWQLLAVGDGDARDAVAAALAPLGQQAVLTGAVAADGVPDLLAGADLLAWPAIGEAYGMAVLEAQAAGLPVVAGRGRGIEGIVAEGMTAVLTPPGAVPALTAALGSLLDDPARRAAMGTAARRLVAQRHDLPQAADRLDAILRQAACAR